MKVAPHRIIGRLHRQRPGEAGLTLIELLISLMLMVLITGFLAGGLAIGRRAFTADQNAAVEAANTAALDSLAGLIATALPTKAGQGPQLAFEGGRETLAFVALSAGHALPGGPLGTRIYRDGTDVGVVVKVAGRSPAAREVRAKALSGVTSLEFTYFGTLDPGKPPAWHAEWPATDHLPDLVGLNVSFQGRSRKPPLLVALRQNDQREGARKGD
jgi:type II secretory pathway pseudopilin PulG